MSTNKEIYNKLEQPTVLSQILSIMIPLLATPIILYCIYMFLGQKEMMALISLSVASFFALGKFVVFTPLHDKVPFTSYQLAMMVVYMDTIVAIVLAYNFHHLMKIYGIGPKLKEIRRDCFYLLKSSKFLRDFAILGIVFFVAFPISGTGAIAGAFLANLLGLTRIWAIFWIFFGSILGSFGLALGAVFFKERVEYFLENPLVIGIKVAILALVLFITGYQMKKKIREEKAKDPNFGKGE